MKILFTSDSLNNTWSIQNISTSTVTSPQSNSTKDNISISSQARQLFNGMQGNKQYSLIESLMKHRESLMEMKKSLTERTIDAGKDITSIQEQLKELEKQIAEIDNQIAKEQTEERNKALGNKEETEKSPSKYEEDPFMTQISLLDQAKTFEQVSNFLAGQKRTLESEIDQDAKRGIFIEKKHKTLIELEDKIQTVQEQINEKQLEASNENSSEENGNIFSDDETKLF